MHVAVGIGMYRACLIEYRHASEPRDDDSVPSAFWLLDSHSHGILLLYDTKPGKKRHNSAEQKQQL